MNNGENILYGGDVGKDDEVRENCNSFGEFLLKTYRRGGDKVILIDGVSGQKLTFLQLQSKAIRLADRMQKLFGIRTGDAVGICSENRMEFAIAMHATLLLGAIVAPVNVTYTEHEMNHALNLSKPKVCFVSVDYFEKIQTVRTQNLFIRKLIVYDDIETNVSHFLKIDGVTTFRRVIDYHDDMQYEGNFQCAPQSMKNVVALILCSSGTTGLPKGVQITQFNLMVANVQHNQRPADLQSRFDEEIVMGILPWFHAYGLIASILMALAGIKIVFLPKFEENACLRCIEKYKATTIHLPPPLMVLLAKSKNVDNYDLSTLKVIWCGAAPLSKDIEMTVKRRLNIRAMRQGYGMTEGTFAFCGQNDEKQSNGSVGVLRRGVFGRVVDTKSGECLGPNEEGELHFKGNCVMKGYVGNEAATNATIDADGWLHTGDVGYYDKNGEWYIVDRIKELIKYKAYQVPPAEIEALLLTNPKIKDAGVIGVPHESAGECAMAFVVKQPGAQITEREVSEYVARRVSPPKRLYGGVRFLDEIPKNPSGKILRRELRELVRKTKSKL